MGKTLSLFNTKQHPRKMSMIGTDNKEYMFLLKGHEDLRQDERVIQIFYLVNLLMAKEKSLDKKNYSATNIKDFDSPNNNIIPDKNNYSHTLNSESTSVTKKKKFEIKPYKSNKSFTETEKEIIEENKENISNNIKIKEK